MPLGKKQKSTTCGVGNGRKAVKAPVRTAHIKMMKRVNQLYETICSVENLMLADSMARKGKQQRYGVMVHDRNRVQNINALHELLLTKKFKTSPYDNFLLNCDNGKVREISRLPYFPDRIVHHAVMNVMEPIWMSVFTTDTYSCIKGRGIHRACRKIKRILADAPEQTIYCLKLDIRKFYPSIDHEILKAILRRKIKDADLLWLLDEIIDSAPGVPIGNYLSQYFANLYLAYFDHWIKETKGVKYYFRYCDDMVILGSDKAVLHTLRQQIAIYLTKELKLQVKDNWQIFPVGKRGIDFLGYRFWHTHTLLRKSIKKSFAVKMAKLSRGPAIRSYAAYWGWAKHCNSYNLINKLTDEKVFGFGGKNRGTDDGEQNKHYPDTEPRNNCTRLQDRREQVPEKQKRQMPVPAGSI